MVRIKFRKILATCILYLLCMVFLSICFTNTSDFVYADSTVYSADIDEICKQMTDSTKFVVDGEEKDITEYESYINKTFQPTNLQNLIIGQVDNWIFNIVPVELFNFKKQNFLFIGEKYGFYFNYNEKDDTYFVFLMLHNFDIEYTSGHIIRKIEPLYYETYIYNQEEGTVALQYFEEIRQYNYDDNIKDPSRPETYTVYYYWKHSIHRKVYLKNIDFNGSLYNLNNYNAGEGEYIAEQDNGGYFIGGSYRFNGVSTQSGTIDFLFDTFLIGVGSIGNNTIGMIMGVGDSIKAIKDFVGDIKNDFRNEITNKNDYSFRITDIERTEQINKYSCIFKDYICVLDTPNTKHGVLYGINKESYAMSTMYYKYADENNKYNTGFVGRIKLDIVEENGSLVDNTPYPIATNIESNMYSAEIYNKKNLNIVENEMTEVYTLAGRSCPISFVAPENGNYTFETFGLVKNNINITSENVNIIKQESNEINKKIIVRLNKDETFRFNSQNISNENGIYYIKAELTPEEISPGEKKTINVKGDQSEYFVFNNINGIGFNYNIGTAGNYTISIYQGDRFNLLQTISMEYKTSGAVATNKKGKYFIKITNNNAADVDLEFTLKNSEDFEMGDSVNFSLGHKALYKIKALPASCVVRFVAQTVEPIKVSVLDENFLNVYSDNEVATNEFLRTLEEGKDYYILFENENIFTVSTNFAVSYSPYELSLGENLISYKSYDSMTCQIILDTDAKISLDATYSITLSLFDSKWQEVENLTGEYLIEGNKTYFIVARGNANNFTISILLDYTESLSGNLGQAGYRFIEFMPEKTDFYEAANISKFEWYDSFLRKHVGELNAGNNYYLKIYGAANSFYDIEILRKYNDLSVGENVNLKDGLYFVDIEESGTYTITTLLSNGVKACYSIYDSEQNILFPRKDAAGKYTLYLDKGGYYIDLEIETDNINSTVDFSIIGDQRLNNDLSDQYNHNILIGLNRDNTFVFVPDSDGIYYLKIAYAGEDVIFDVSLTDVNLNAIKTTVIPLYQESQGKKYGLSMALNKNTKYYVNIYCIKTDSSYNEDIPYKEAEIWLKKHIGIQNADLKAEDSNQRINIISSSQAQSMKTLIMGRSYILETSGEYLLWKISDGISSDLKVQIIGNKLIIDFDVNSYQSEFIVNIVDDLGTFDISFKIDYPYTVGIEYDSNNWIYKNYLIDTSGANEIRNANIEKIEVSAESVKLEIDGNSFSIFELYENGLNANTFRIQSKVHIDYKGYKYCLQANAMDIKPATISIDVLENADLTNYKYLLIDTRKNISDKIFAIPQNLEKVILYGETSRKLINVVFDFKNNIEGRSFALYLLNYSAQSVKKPGGFNHSLIKLNYIDTSSIYLTGENNITGWANDFLFRARALNFFGKGTLNIIGEDGKHGADGANIGTNGQNPGDDGHYAENGVNGVAGSSALYCTSVIKQGECVIILRGGNGGNGGKGSNGGNGADIGYKDNPSGKRGGKGADGGDGGYGGDAGVGCVIRISEESEIQTTDGVAGCGGNGGHGGNGGDGACSNTYINSQSEGVATPTSSGGNGGNGGKAGTCGNGNHNCLKPRGGDGGNGGDGGHGNSIEYLYNANTAVKIAYAEASYGGNGGNGGKGYYGGNGGNGGRGGNGANGLNATMFSKGENGYDGYSGGNGGKGGNSISSSANVGLGGKCGLGGIGGEGGKKMSVFKGGEKGADGRDGSNGSNGQYVTSGSGSGSSGGDSCVATGTLITLADGRQVPVETLKGDEMLLVWDIFNGKFEISPILFVDKDEERMYNIINLRFSDGTSVKVIDEHGFWDFDLNKYVFLREDADKYIGHYFNKQTVDEEGNFGYTKVRLEEVEITQEYTAAWSPVTYGHLCYYVNGMLSMPGATGGLINIFDVDAKTMTVDKQAYEVDIELYGLYTYEEFSSKYEIPQEIFEAFGGKYLKAAIGKGLITEDEISALITRYSAFWQAND